jgi:hypothetical protein
MQQSFCPAGVSGLVRPTPQLASSVVVPSIAFDCACNGVQGVAEVLLYGEQDPNNGTQ